MLISARSILNSNATSGKNLINELCLIENNTLLFIINRSTQRDSYNTLAYNK